MHSTGSISARGTSITRPARSAIVGRRAGSRRASVETRWLADDVAELLEPERRHGGEHPALVGDRLGHHHVEGRHAVGGDHQQAAVAGVVDVADLAGVDVGQVDRRQIAHGGRR